MNFKLMDHQTRVLQETKDISHVAYYMDMGLGKTFVGAEKAITLGDNILVVCQKSKVQDWLDHFTKYYNSIDNAIVDLTQKGGIVKLFNLIHDGFRGIGVINYDLVWRRKELINLTDFTLMLDESSLIQNDKSKRSKFILKKLKFTNVVLLSGTPVSGKYENLLSQIHLLGWNISDELFKRQYVIYSSTDEGFPIVVGYQNVDRLKRKLREHGCIFMKTDDVMDLPEQRFIDVKVKEPKEYFKFLKSSIVKIGDKELIGDSTLLKLLYARQICGIYNQDKLSAIQDLIESTEDRLVIFYNFNDELEAIKSVIPTNRPLSFINGQRKDLSNYEKFSNSITLCQYQAAAMGHNLQLANKIIYYSPTLSSELFEQSKKRIHRIGQKNNCIYYLLKSGIEHNIYSRLQERKNYTDELFKEEFK